MKSSARARSPEKIWGRAPMALTSAAWTTGFCGAFGPPRPWGAGAPPPPPPPPPPLPPPGFPPGLRRSALLSLAEIEVGVAAAVVDGVAALDAVVWVVGAVIRVAVVDIGCVTNRGLMGWFLMYWLIGSFCGRSLSLSSESSSD